jgi:hypothetical protein
MKIARLMGLVLSVLMVLLGLTALAMPDRVLPFARFTTTPNGVYVAAGIRFAIAIILLFAALASRFPKVLRVVAILALLGGIATLAFGVSGGRAFQNVLSNNGTIVLRVIGAFLTLVGSFIGYAVASGRRNGQ